MKILKHKYKGGNSKEENERLMSEFVAQTHSQRPSLDLRDELHKLNEKIGNETNTKNELEKGQIAVENKDSILANQNQKGKETLEMNATSEEETTVTQHRQQQTAVQPLHFISKFELRKFSLELVDDHIYDRNYTQPIILLTAKELSAQLCVRADLNFFFELCFFGSDVCFCGCFV